MSRSHVDGEPTALAELELPMLVAAPIVLEPRGAGADAEQESEQEAETAACAAPGAGACPCGVHKLDTDNLYKRLYQQGLSILNASRKP